ncbi:outer membrane beta-barrel protein [Polaribacter staleyi]|uniref:outer membrane beta-barrel protein n=1 Tax=Polaribacter staleyi TaxID=2022337 RepID=UPI003BF5E9B2
MKKVILMMFLALGFNQLSNAQVDFGIKAGVNYNNGGDDSVESLGTDVIDGAKAKSGYHAGIWFRGDIPVLGLYVRPEIVYTEIKSEYAFNSVKTDYDFKKIDVPVLLGKKFLGVANAFIGPSFQYILDDNFKFENLTTDEFDKFSVGLQMGVGVELGRLGIDVRWERGLSNTEAKFANSITVDNRTNQIIFGLSLRL